MGRWGNLLTFEGRINRAQFWLIVIVNIAPYLALQFIPVKHHEILLSTFGGAGHWYVRYATPIEPETSRSLAFFAAYILGWAAIYWVLIAAMVLRLHDLGRSGKWVLLPFGGLALITLLEAVFSRPSTPLSAVDIVTLILLVPVIVIGVWGMFLMYFARGRGS